MGLLKAAKILFESPRFNIGGFLFVGLPGYKQFINLCQYTLFRVLFVKNRMIIFVLVFHRILDFKRGRISIQAPFYF